MAPLPCLWSGDEIATSTATRKRSVARVSGDAFHHMKKKKKNLAKLNF